MNEQLQVIITANVEKFQNAVKGAKQTLKEFVKEGKHIEEITQEFQKYGNAAKQGLKVAAGAMVGATTALLGMTAATAEYRNAQAGLITSFEAAGSSAEQAKKTYNDLYRVMGDNGAATEAAQSLARVTTEEKALGEYTTILTGIYAKYGEGMPIETIAEAIAETAACGTVTGDLSRALIEAGVSEDAFNESLQACTTQAEREALIRETLNGLYSDAAAKYEENNAATLAQNEANAKVSASMAKIGEALAPVNAMLAELGAEILAELSPYITAFAEKYLPTIKKVLEEVGNAIGKVIGWIADNWELVSTIGAIVLAIAAAIATVSTALSVYNGIMAITSVVTAPVSLTVLAIVAAIAALIAIIVVCIKYWDEIKAAISKAIDAIKAAVSAGFEVINQNIIQPIENAYNTVKQTFNNIVSTIKNTINKAKDAVKSAVDKIKEMFNFKVSLPKIKLPHFSIKPKGWQVGDLLKGKIPKLGIEWYAKGGVFDKPTLFPYGNGAIGGLGENGAEAVVPLEKNTQWLDRLAEMLAAKQGKTPIVLKVDGKVFGEIACDSINNLTKQRGSLALNLV